MKDNYGVQLLWRVATYVAVVLLMAGIVSGATGCSVSQRMDLAIDGSGSVEVEIELGRIFREYYRDLSGETAFDSSEIFDTAEIRRVLESYTGIDVETVSAPDAGRLRIQAQMQDVEELFRDDTLEVPEIAYFVRDGQEATLHMRFGREDIPRFLALSPIGDSPVVEYLLPPGDELGREEYIEYLGWALEEYEEGTPVADVVRAAAIELRIRPAGEILVQRGGVVDGDTAVFEVPLIDLVLAQDPLEYSLRFRAEQSGEAE